jgi:hypothetical protein
MRSLPLISNKEPLYRFLAVIVWKSGKMFSKLEYRHFSKVLFINHTHAVNTTCIILHILIHIIIQHTDTEHTRCSDACWQKHGVVNFFNQLTSISVLCWSCICYQLFFVILNTSVALKQFFDVIQYSPNYPSKHDQRTVE